MSLTSNLESLTIIQQSFNNLVEQWSTNTGKNITVTHIPISKTKEAYEKNPSDFISLLKVILDSGHGDISKSEYGIANILWPEWKPASVWDTFKDIYELQVLKVSFYRYYERLEQFMNSK